MKKTRIIAVAAFLLFAFSAKAQYKMGLGVRLSSNEATINNSASFKYFFGKSIAAEALLSFNPVALGLLVEKHQSLLGKRLRWFYGGGGYVGFGDGRNLGLQAVVGIDYKLPLIPLNFSLDWKPELNLARRFFFEGKAIGFSARFTFK